MRGFKVSYKTERLAVQQTSRIPGEGVRQLTTSETPVMQAFDFQYESTLKHKYVCPACEQYLWDMDEQHL
jgi:hypothetical protein